MGHILLFLTTYGGHLGFYNNSLKHYSFLNFRSDQLQKWTQSSLGHSAKKVRSTIFELAGRPDGSIAIARRWLVCQAVVNISLKPISSLSFRPNRLKLSTHIPWASPGKSTSSLYAIFVYGSGNEQFL